MKRGDVIGSNLPPLDRAGMPAALEAAAKNGRRGGIAADA